LRGIVILLQIFSTGRCAAPAWPQGHPVFDIFRARPDRFDKRRPPSYMSHSPQHPGNDRPSRSMSIVLDAGVSFAESRRM
jgi:hypothetical protein